MADPAPAVQQGRVIGATATYFDRIRQSKPATVLANEYIAFKTVYQKLGQDNAKLYQVPNAFGGGADYNQLHFYEPTFTPADFLSETFHQACIACYEEFRVRCVKVTLHSITADMMGLNSDPMWKVPSWIWYPDNHIGLVPEDEIGDYTDMLESGEKFQKCGMKIDDNLVMRAVPQLSLGVYMNQAGAMQFKDVPAPWQSTSAYNLGQVYRMPLFVWRKHYAANAGITAAYQITMSAIIEFRNPRDSQL